MVGATGDGGLGSEAYFFCGNNLWMAYWHPTGLGNERQWHHPNKKNCPQEKCCLEHLAP